GVCAVMERSHPQRGGCFLFDAAATRELYPLSLHDALPIWVLCWRNGQRSPIHDHRGSSCGVRVLRGTMTETQFAFAPNGHVKALDRKSTRLNSSHLVISYAVFCLKKKIPATSSHPGSTNRT